MRLFLILFASLLFAFQASAQYPHLTDDAEIALITMSPGQSELYTAFGHSAIRVVDSTLRINAVFNYGIFSFNQPNFYLNFTKGKLYYELGVRSYRRTLNWYIGDNRTITEQYLDLSLEDKQNLFNLLMINSEPENKNYYYNYCYDNCATRIRDVLNDVLGDRVQYDFSYADDSLSYRGLMDQYLGQQPWGDLGIDFCLGSEIDRVADGPAYTYMPEYLLESFATAVVNENDSSRSLIKETRIVNTAAPMPNAASFIQPIHVFVLVFFIVGILIHRGLKYGVSYRWIDIILFGSTGLLSFFLLFLWFGTDHLSQYNYNMIWCSPLSLIALILLLTKRYLKHLVYFFYAFGAVLIFQILFREMMTQVLHFAFIPLVLAMALRSFYLGYEIRKNLKPTAE